jgi:hypothetical protein
VRDRGAHADAEARRRSLQFAKAGSVAAKRCCSKKRATWQMCSGAALSLAAMYLADSFAAGAP